MALADSRNAIGAVGQLLQSQLMARTSVGNVEVGRVEAAASGAVGPKLNLFLYHVDVDAQLRNASLDDGQPAPVWLVLRYLLTAFDDQRDSDSVGAHQLLGEGMLALHELNFQWPASLALADNPEPLKITFESADPELLSKLMQGTDERYRVSAAFEMRPVLIATSEPPDYAPLVHFIGEPGDEGVDVIPSLGPVLTGVDPGRFEAGASLRVRGEGLGSAVEWVCLGDACFPVTAAPAGGVVTVIPADTGLSPASYPLTVARELPSGRRLSSNALLVELQPSLATAAPVLPLSIDAGNRFGDLTLGGSHLGGPEDTIFVAFWRDGTVALMLEANGVATQDNITVSVSQDDALPPARYLIILRVNGVQAPLAPEVDWT